MDVTDWNVNFLGKLGFSLWSFPSCIQASWCSHSSGALPLHTFRRHVQRYLSKYPTKTFSGLQMNTP